jgi:intracellular multiplication protein IcmS
MENVTQVMAKITKAMKVNFTLNGKPMTHEEVFAPTGLMPAIAKRADQLCALCLGYGLGVTFEDEKGSVVGVKAKFDKVTPDVLRYLCMADVVGELVKAAPMPESVPLDELMYD